MDPATIKIIEDLLVTAFYIPIFYCAHKLAYIRRGSVRNKKARYEAANPPPVTRLSDIYYCQNPQ
jgi:hypothetical protein